MRKVLIVVNVMIVAVLLLSLCAAQVTAAPTATITLLNPPPSGILELAVGESHTFEVQITSDEPFVLALAMTNAYYPGRGVYWHGGDHASRGTSAVLHLTMTGKKSTADLAAVCDWPQPGLCYPEGVAPVAIAAGVRYQGGEQIAQQFAFGVVVP